MSVLVIAEAGIAFGRSRTALLDMVAMAHSAGADAVKFQWWSSPTRMAEHRGGGFDLFDAYATPLEWLQEARGMALSLGLEFMCTVYVPEDIPVIVPLVSRFKVGSAEAVSHEFIQAHRAYGQEVIVSTGAMSDGQLIALLGRFRYLVKDPIRVLHCVSGYPTPMNQVNFRVMKHYGMDGFSDHTGEVVTGALAVAHGAQIVEVHYRHPEVESTHPDFAVSHNPGSLRRYIQNIRLAEQAAGSNKKTILESERWLREK